MFKRGQNIMNTKELWEEFEATGSIESYMRYKGIKGFDIETKADELTNDENARLDY
jgi:hypothetical protein